MSFFLVARVTYTQFQIALCKGSVLVDHSSQEKNMISAQFLSLLEQLLKRNSVTLAECIAIAVDVGPAPFTSLRTLFATLNGLASVSKVPLIPLNGPLLFAQTEHAVKAAATLALYNAYNKEVFYALMYKQREKIGCISLQELAPRVREVVGTDTVLCIGQAVQLYTQELKELFATQIITSEQSKTELSLEALTAKAAVLVEDKNSYRVDQVYPLYQKQFAYLKAS